MGRIIRQLVPLSERLEISLLVFEFVARRSGEVLKVCRRKNGRRQQKSTLAPRKMSKVAASPRLAELACTACCAPSRAAQSGSDDETNGRTCLRNSAAKRAARSTARLWAGSSRSRSLRALRCRSDAFRPASPWIQVRSAGSTCCSLRARSAIHERAACSVSKRERDVQRRKGSIFIFGPLHFQELRILTTRNSDTMY